MAKLKEVNYSGKQIPDYRNIVPFFYKWEGGLSKDPNDSASSYMCPCGYHTNKGVTYTTWVSMFGKDEEERFMQMNDEDWGKIFKVLYWDRVRGDELTYQSIANVLVSWAWGSGATTAIRELQRVLGIKVDGILGNQTLSAIRESDEVELFDKCVKAREAFFRKIAEINPKNKRFLKGWLNRLREFNETFRP